MKKTKEKFIEENVYFTNNKEINIPLNFLENFETFKSLPMCIDDLKLEENDIYLSLNSIDYTCDEEVINSHYNIYLNSKNNNCILVLSLDDKFYGFCLFD